MFDKLHLQPAAHVFLSKQALSTVHGSNVGGPPACLGMTRLGRHLSSAPGSLLRHAARIGLTVQQEGEPAY